MRLRVRRRAGRGATQPCIQGVQAHTGRPRQRVSASSVRESRRSARRDKRSVPAPRWREGGAASASDGPFGPPPPTGGAARARNRWPPPQARQRPTATGARVRIAPQPVDATSALRVQVASPAERRKRTILRARATPPTARQDTIGTDGPCVPQGFRSSSRLPPGSRGAGGRVHVPPGRVGPGRGLRGSRAWLSLPPPASA